MLHPALEPYVRRARENPEPHPSTVGIDQRRAAYRAECEELRGEPVELARVEERRLELAGRTIGARLYVPVAEEGRALIVYFHGGDFVMGDLDTHDPVCRRLAADTRMSLLAVDYRLAPEHPFPDSVDDAIDTVRYVAAHRGDFASPGAHLVVMGDSAGAALAAAAVNATRDEKLGLAAQVLIYPTLGPELLTDSAHVYATGYLCDVEPLRYDYSLYLGEWRDHTDPRISPLMSVDLTGAAPAIVVVAHFDPLRDEAIAYAGLLEHFGTPVELLEAEGMIHGFLSFGGVVPEANAIIDDLADHLRHLVAGAS